MKFWAAKDKESKGNVLLCKGLPKLRKDGYFKASEFPVFLSDTFFLGLTHENSPKLYELKEVVEPAEKERPLLYRDRSTFEDVFPDWDCRCKCGRKFWKSENTGVDGVTVCPCCHKPFAG